MALYRDVLYYIDSESNQVKSVNLANLKDPVGPVNVGPAVFFKLSSLDIYSPQYFEDTTGKSKF